jgi:hypothetical protein
MLHGLVSGLSALAQAPDAGARPAGPITLTQPVLDAWLASVRDPRVCRLLAGSLPDEKKEFAPDTIRTTLRKLDTDVALGDLVRPCGFVSGRAWVDAALKVYSGILGALMDKAREELDAGGPDKRSREYRDVMAELKDETGRIQAVLGALTPDEQKVVTGSLEDIRLAMRGERPLAKDPLTLEQLQRWIAASEDAPVSGALKSMREHFGDGPTGVRKLIVTAGVGLDIDAAARANGFAGGFEWAAVTSKIIGAMLEHTIEVKLDKLDAEAADHRPEEYQKLVDAANANMAAVHRAFGARSQASTASPSCARSATRAMGSSTLG